MKTVIIFGLVRVVLYTKTCGDCAKFSQLVDGRTWCAGYGGSPGPQPHESCGQFELRSEGEHIAVDANSVLGKIIARKG